MSTISNYYKWSENGCRFREMAFRIIRNNETLFETRIDFSVKKKRTEEALQKTELSNIYKIIKSTNSHTVTLHTSINS